MATDISPFMNLVWIWLFLAVVILLWWHREKWSKSYFQKTEPDHSAIVEASMRRLAVMDENGQVDPGKSASKLDAAIKLAEQNLDSFELFDYVLGVFDARRKHPPSQSGTENSTALFRKVAHAANLVVVAFESEGIEWSLEHWNEEYFSEIYSVALLLELDDMTGPIIKAREYFAGTATPSWKDRTIETNKAFLAEVQQIESSFEQSGGVVRFVTSANEYLRKNVDRLAALGRLEG